MALLLQLSCFLSFFMFREGVKLNLGGWPGSRDDIDGEEITLDRFPSGALSGRRRPIEAGAGGDASSVDWFLGIPYAAPPTGHKRFKPPEPVEKWTNVKQATRFGSVCPQSRDGNPKLLLGSSEDCLTLNVFSPFVSETDNTKYPVMVFIHGGSYQSGTGASYQGQILAQQGLVVVTFNYRLGILGFISGRAKQLPGNYGLLDQIAVLNWVKDNIHHFRGDPDKVTLYGNNAGATSVGILSVSPLAKGLFTYAILQGGSPLAIWAAHNSTVDLYTHTKRTAKVYGCTGLLFGSIVHCLRETNVTLYEKKELQENVSDISLGSTNFKPVAYGDVIDKDIEELYKNGSINPARFMIGVTDKQWSTFITPLLSDIKNEDKFDNKLGDGFNRSSFERALRHNIAKLGWDPSLSEMIIQEYTNWTHVNDPKSNKDELVRLVNDLTLKSPATRVANLLADRNIPVYFYNFNHRSVSDKFKTTQTDVDYVFGGPYIDFSVYGGHYKEFSEGNEDKSMSQYMMTLWKDFATSGNPSESTSTHATKEVWTPYNSETQNYLNLNITPHMHEKFNRQGNTFWMNVFPGVKAKFLQPPPPWWQMTELSWALVALAGTLLIIVIVLSIVLHVKGRKTKDQV